MRRWLAGVVIALAFVVAGCGLLQSAATNPNVQAFVFEKITNIMRDTLEDELENVPFTLDYDHAEEVVRTNGTIRDGEHVWMVTIKDKDLKKALPDG